MERVSTSAGPFDVPVVKQEDEDEDEDDDESQQQGRVNEKREFIRI